MKKEVLNYLFIIMGSILYAIATVVFIFPHSLLLGGTSGISVILNEYISFSPGTILVIINFSLLVAAFVVLGKDMAIKTFVGSTLTTAFVGVFEKIFYNSTILVSNIYVSAVLGASLIAIASGIMFYVKSSSGGTDIIALILAKRVHVSVAVGLIIADVITVLVGGFLEPSVMLPSVVGFAVKVGGVEIFTRLARRFILK